MCKIWSALTQVCFAFFVKIVFFHFTCSQVPGQLRRQAVLVYRRRMARCFSRHRVSGLRHQTRNGQLHHAAVARRLRVRRCQRLELESIQNSPHHHMSSLHQQARNCQLSRIVVARLFSGLLRSQRFVAEPVQNKPQNHLGSTTMTSSVLMLKTKCLQILVKRCSCSGYLVSTSETVLHGVP